LLQNIQACRISADTNDCLILRLFELYRRTIGNTTKYFMDCNVNVHCTRSCSRNASKMNNINDNNLYDEFLNIIICLID